MAIMAIDAAIYSDVYTKWNQPSGNCFCPGRVLGQPRPKGKGRELRAQAAEKPWSGTGPTMQINFLNYLSCTAVPQGSKALGYCSQVFTFPFTPRWRPPPGSPPLHKAHLQTMRQ